MPFTLAHPAAVLLLARGPLSLLALVSGAVAPDLPYYLRATPLPVTADSWYEPFVNATSSHSWEQLLPVALPLALCVYAGGRLLLPPLRWVAGVEPQGAPPAPEVAGTVRRGAWVVVALLIGVLTHVAWDALTELGGSRSSLLQHGSSVLGLLALVWVALRRRQVIRWYDVTARRRIVAASLSAVVAALVGASAAVRPWLEPPSGASAGEVVEGALTDAATGAGAGLAAAAAVLALVWWAGAPRRKLRTSLAPGA